MSYASLLFVAFVAVPPSRLSFSLLWLCRISSFFFKKKGTYLPTSGQVFIDRRVSYLPTMINTCINNFLGQMHFHVLYSLSNLIINIY